MGRMGRLTRHTEMMRNLQVSSFWTRLHEEKVREKVSLECVVENVKQSSYLCKSLQSLEDHEVKKLITTPGHPQIPSHPQPYRAHTHLSSSLTSFITCKNTAQSDPHSGRDGHLSIPQGSQNHTLPNSHDITTTTGTSNSRGRIDTG